MSRSYETIRFPLTPMKLKILSASASSVCLHQSIFHFMCLMPNLYSGEINFLYIFLSPTFPSCLEHALFLLLPDCAHFLRLSSYSTPASFSLSFSIRCGLCFFETTSVVVLRSNFHCLINTGIVLYLHGYSFSCYMWVGSSRISN